MHNNHDHELATVRRLLHDLNLSAVARATGLSTNTLYRLMRPDTQPHYATVKKVMAYLQRRDLWTREVATHG